MLFGKKKKSPIGELLEEVALAVAVAAVDSVVEVVTSVDVASVEVALVKATEDLLDCDNSGVKLAEADTVVLL